MKLYGARFSPYFERVHLVWTLKGKPDAVELVGLPEGGLKSDAYLRIHPGGKIPCLVLDDGTALPESQVICGYLDRVLPGPALVPEDVIAQSRMELICQLVDTTLFPAFRPLMVSEPTREAADGARAAVRVVDHFVGVGSFAVGDTWSLADCALLPALHYARVLGQRASADLLDDTRQLGDYADRMLQLETAQESRAAMSQLLGS